MSIEPAAPMTYDAAGRLTGIPGVLGSVSYAASGQPLVQTNANGTVTTRSYAPERGFLTGIQTMAGGTTIQNLGYAIDPAGLVQQVTSPFGNESWSYSYDDLYRLTQATSSTNPGESQSWTYDAIGRITSNSRLGAYTYPASGQPRPHAPLSAGSNTYSYDANGNLYSGAGRAITWNASNLPSAVTVSGTTTSFTYGVITKYVSVPGLGVVAKRVNSTTYWLHQDRLGSITAVTDSAGSTAQRRSFRAYGETIASQTGHVESRGWIGQRNDAETGLTYLHARYFDPAIGSFLSPDPSHPTGRGVGLHRYGYGAGNPVNLVDPSGLWWACGISNDHWVFDYKGDGTPVGQWKEQCVWVPEYVWVPGSSGSNPTGGPGPDRRERQRNGSCHPSRPACQEPQPVCPGDPSCTEAPPVCVPGDPGCPDGQVPAGTCLTDCGDGRSGQGDGENRNEDDRSGEGDMGTKDPTGPGFQPPAFGDPCSQGWWGRFGDSLGYLTHQTVRGAVYHTAEAAHLAEIGMLGGTAAWTASLASQAARGVGSWAPVAYVGAPEFLAAEAEGLTVAGAAGVAALGISGGYLFSAAWDATTANDYCPR